MATRLALRKPSARHVQPRGMGRAQRVQVRVAPEHKVDRRRRPRFNPQAVPLLGVRMRSMKLIRLAAVGVSLVWSAVLYLAGVKLPTAAQHALAHLPTAAVVLVVA